MDDVLATCIREVAQLDQLEAMLLEMFRDARTERRKRAIRVRLTRLSRVRAIWQRPLREQPKGSNL